MDRSSRLARCLEVASRVSASRVARWQSKGLLPETLMDSAGNIPDQVVAHLRELDGLVGRGKANTDTGAMAYEDRVALILAARGHACARLHDAYQWLFHLTDIRAQLATMSEADRLDVIEDVARAIHEDPSYFNVLPQFMRDALTLAYSNVSRSCRSLEGGKDSQDETPESAVFALIYSTLNGLFGNGSYNQEVHAASAGLSPRIVNDPRVLKLRDSLSRIRIDPASVLDETPMDEVVATAVLIRPYARTTPVMLGLKWTTEEADLIAGLGAPFVLALGQTLRNALAELVKFQDDPELIAELSEYSYGATQ